MTKSPQSKTIDKATKPFYYLHLTKQGNPALSSRMTNEIKKFLISNGFARKYPSWDDYALHLYRDTQILKSGVRRMYWRFDCYPDYGFQITKAKNAKKNEELIALVRRLFGADAEMVNMQVRIKDRYEDHEGKIALHEKMLIITMDSNAIYGRNLPLPNGHKRMSVWDIKRLAGQMHNSQSYGTPIIKTTPLSDGIHEVKGKNATLQIREIPGTDLWYDVPVRYLETV